MQSTLNKSSISESRSQERSLKEAHRVHQLVVTDPKRGGPCAQVEEWKHEEVDEKHIEQVVHQKEVAVKIADSKRPSPLPKGDRMENLLGRAGKVLPSVVQGPEELDKQREHRFLLDQEAQKLLKLCGSSRQRRRRASGTAACWFPRFLLSPVLRLALTRPDLATGPGHRKANSEPDDHTEP